MKRICFVAQFPPPMHGLSKAVETLYNSELSKEFAFEKVDITDNRAFPKNLLAIARSRADLFYFTISQTRGGNLRDLAIMKLLKLRGKRCLVHLHGGYYRQLVDNDLPGWQRKANYKAVKALAGAIVLGPGLKPIFRGMLPEEKIYTVPNCVDDEYLMSGEDFQAKLASLPGRKVRRVLYLSNFIRTKGYPHVLEMAALEKARVEAGGERRFHFDFAGKFFEKEEEDFFKNYVAEHGLEDYVTLHGVVGGDEKRALLRECDVFALLTTYPNEGQPISILEAMGNGLLVVATDHAGIPDIADETCGLILPANQPDPAEWVYRRLIAEDCRDRVVAARRRVDRLYRQENYIRNMERVFEEVR